MKNKKILLYLVLSLTIFLTACTPKSNVIITETTPPTTTQTEPTIEETEPTVTIPNPEKTVKLTIALDDFSNKIIELQVPEAIVEKVELVKNGQHYILLHSETKYNIFTIIIDNEYSGDYDNFKEQNYEKIYCIYGDSANNLTDAGKEINAIREYLKEIFMSVKIIDNV